MIQYHDMLRHILAHGTQRGDRTGTGTFGVFGYQNRYDLRDGFPLVTTKKVHVKSIIHELVWFLRGETNNEFLKERGVRIWEEWSTEEQCARFGRKTGDLGPVYGHQWNNFGATKPDAVDVGGAFVDGEYIQGANILSTGYFPNGVNQIKWLVEEIQKNPNSRRLIVSGWNPAEQGQVALPPCHTMFQFYVQDGKLSCQLYQRSADVFLGVPFNIASYSILTHLIAKVCNLGVGEFIHTFGDLHIYNNHMEQVNLQLQREPFPLPHLAINDRLAGLGYEGIKMFDIDDVVITGYQCHAAIKAEVSV